MTLLPSGLAASSRGLFPTKNTILKNIFIYSTYLCVRNTIKTEEQTNKLLYIIILCSFIILFVAIDRLYFNLFENVYEYLNIKYLNVKYLSGSFGYKNAFSIYFLLCLFISIYLSVWLCWLLVAAHRTFSHANF